jgi:3-isopropylmalate/(R)-2-methylmalate dehydratase large subunit
MRTYFDKVWEAHVIRSMGENGFLIHIDRHFLHEVSGAVSLKSLDEAGLAVRNPELTFATIDHVVDTHAGRGMTSRIPRGEDFMRELATRAREHQIRMFDLEDVRQGIVHVIAPELGIVLPGMTFVCGDSHTCTVGGVGAFAFGIGASDGEHVLATQTMVQTRPKTMRVTFEGQLAANVSAKDMILALIGRYGTSCGLNYAVEFAGPAVRALPMQGRLTMCNMAVEMGARTGLVAPDDVTYDFLHGRPFAPSGALWDQAVATWRSLPSDDEASYDQEFSLDCAALAPQITWGTSPEDVISIDGAVPDPTQAFQGETRAAKVRALGYMGLEGGQRLEGLAIDAAFIGSCTNSRLDDLRAAAAFLKGRRVAQGVRAICTPGSTSVRLAAEAEGLHQVFRDAGFEWGEAGCSLCFSAGGDSFPPGARVISTTNRNFEDRQGAGVRSHLASPVTVALSAVRGRISDVRKAGA